MRISTRLDILSSMMYLALALHLPSALVEPFNPGLVGERSLGIQVEVGNEAGDVEVSGLDEQPIEYGYEAVIITEMMGDATVLLKGASLDDGTPVAALMSRRNVDVCMIAPGIVKHMRTTDTVVRQNLGLSTMEVIEMFGAIPDMADAAADEWGWKTVERDEMIDGIYTQLTSQAVSVIYPRYHDALLRRFGSDWIEDLGGVDERTMPIFAEFHDGVVENNPDISKDDLALAYLGHSYMVEEEDPMNTSGVVLAVDGCFVHPLHGVD